MLQLYITLNMVVMVDMVVGLLGCVCPYSVCLALPVTGGGRAQCVIGFERSAALTF